MAGVLADLATAQAHPDGDHRNITVVEYFDYNCPVCRGLEPELRKLLAADPKVHLVRKDWPIFGDGSLYAAYASFAARRQGRYQAAHDALISSSGDLDTKADVLAVLKAAGFDAAKIDSDVMHHAKEYAGYTARVRREAEALGLHGTPGLIVGNQLVAGGKIDSARLQRLIASLRSHS
jgi:protein-disulfide isomerase